MSISLIVLLESLRELRGYLVRSIYVGLYSRVSVGLQYFQETIVKTLSSVLKRHIAATNFPIRQLISATQSMIGIRKPWGDWEVALEHHKESVTFLFSLEQTLASAVSNSPFSDQGPSVNMIRAQARSISKELSQRDRDNDDFKTSLFHRRPVT